MSDDLGDVTTPDEFQRLLRALLESASESGVDVSGGWACTTESSDETWDVVVTRVVNDDGRD